MPVPAFIPGIELSRRFYRDVVRGLIEQELGGLPYAAGLLGSGSDVLGFDTERSTDHNWGPRLFIFVPRDAAGEVGPRLSEQLRWTLPRSFSGYSVHFGTAGADGARIMESRDSGPVEHKILVMSFEELLESTLGFTNVEALTPVDWLVASDQALLELTAGAVFYDGLETVTRARRALTYYPDDVWRYLLAAQWKRISQQEAFVGRTGEVSDEIGSAVIGADLVRDVMRLAFLIERRYAPYAKWFGTAFTRLERARELTPLLQQAFRATGWQEREAALGRAYSVLAAAHNRLKITEPMPVETSPFHGRPFHVIHGERFADAISVGIKDEAVKRLPPGVGSVDQWIDSTDVLSASGRRAKLRGLYT